jgi:ABC-2 type transport system permease protein
MIALVRTELLKLYWTRATWVFLLAAVLLVLVRLELLLAGLGRVGAPARGSTELTLAVLGTSGVGIFVITLLGVVTVTREFQNATWTSTLLASPNRTRVVVAKVVAGGLTGTAVAALLLLVTVVRGMAAGALHLTLDAALLRTIPGGLVTAAWWAWLGVAVGLVVRNQTAALVVPLVWMLVVETLLPAYGLQALVRWTPGGATRALAGDPAAGLLPVWAAALLLLGYATVLTVVGTRGLVRSDVS